MFELDIAHYFARLCSFTHPPSSSSSSPTHPPSLTYLNVFVSCNDREEEKEEEEKEEEEEGGRRWCLRCPKCLFVYLLLSAFLPPRRVKEEGFGGVCLLDKGELCGLLCELLGVGEEPPSPLSPPPSSSRVGDTPPISSVGGGGWVGGRKPLECVGLPEEVAEALRLTKRRWEEEEEERVLPVLLRKGLAVVEGGGERWRMPAGKEEEEEEEEEEEGGRWPVWFKPIRMK